MLANKKKQIIEELKEIQSILYKEYVKADIVNELNGLNVDSLVQQIKEPEIISSIDPGEYIKENTKTTKDLIHAMWYWNVSNLLDFDSPQRQSLCVALITKAKELGVKPKQLWVYIVSHPYFFDKWSEEIDDGRITHTPLD